MNVVVLSAGQGGRLLPLTTNRPKCLIDFGGRSLLEWQVRALAAAGLDRITVVTGFGADQVREEAARLSAALSVDVRTLHNPFYGVADNLASCWMARAELGGPTLILNGDTLIEPAIVERLLAAPPAPITVSIDRKASYDADDMKVRTEGGRLLAIGKTLSEGVNGESIGFLRFDLAGARLFVEAIEAAMTTPEGLQRWYLSAIDQIAAHTDEVTVASVEGLEWGEVDFPIDVTAGRALTQGWLAREAEASDRRRAG